MQSELGLPRIILAVYPRLSSEEGAKYRDSSMRIGRTCMSTLSLFFIALFRKETDGLRKLPPLDYYA
jgi:hypothetical protein